MANSTHTFAFIGNWDRYKQPPGNGFGICQRNPETGKLRLLKSVIPDIAVGSACLHPKRNILYCTDEYTILPGNYQGGGGQVYALTIDPETGDLAEINHQPSYGTLPSYITVDASGEYLLATHHTDRVPITKILKDPSGKFRIALEYDDAATVLFPLNADGSIGDPCDVHLHSGDGGPLARQTHPQLHSIKMAPSGKFFVVCDKGNDEIVSFRINRERSQLELCGNAVKLLPGSSPRYSVFHPVRPFLFVNYETKALVSSFRYDQSGHLEMIRTVSALPDECADDPAMKQSDLSMHPSGKYLYSMLRGISAISIFDIDEETGAIRRRQTLALDGTGPRGCTISPDGQYMYITAMTSHEVLLWKIEPDGSLTCTGEKLSQPNPCLVTLFPAF